MTGRGEPLARAYVRLRDREGAVDIPTGDAVRLDIEIEPAA